MPRGGAPRLPAQHDISEHALGPLKRAGGYAQGGSGHWRAGPARFYHVRMIEQKTLTFDTRGRGTTDITREIERAVAASGVRTGLCHLFLQHTSASLILCENAAPAVRQDLETVMSRLAPDGDPDYLHDDEGPDDMAAHVRSVLTSNSLTVPVGQGRLMLGTWQGIYLWEHRLQRHSRRLVVTVQGETD
jgi:secondary thiamine-phosphate synthase enzyme